MNGDIKTSSFLRGFDHRRTAGTTPRWRRGLIGFFREWQRRLHWSGVPVLGFSLKRYPLLLLDRRRFSLSSGEERFEHCVDPFSVAVRRKLHIVPWPRACTIADSSEALVDRYLAGNCLWNSYFERSTRT